MIPEYKILHVEDLPTDAVLAEREIRKALKSCVLHVVETRAEFLAELDIFKPDIIVSDFQLPTFDGLSVLKLTLEKSPHIPVIILTGSQNEDTAVECMKAGATDYVIKEHIKRLGPAVLNAFEQQKIKLEKIETLKLLKQSEERFRSLFQDNLSVMLIIDAESGRIMDANHSAIKYYGWAKKQLINFDINDINVTGNLKVNEQHGKKLQEQLHHETKHRLANGEVRDVEVFTSNISIHGKQVHHYIVHDISERKLAEEQVILLSRAIEQSPVTVMITNKEGLIEYVNPRFSEVTGYSVNEVLGKNPRILQSGEHSKEFYRELWNTILSGKNWQGKLHNKRKNGESYWEDALISPILDNQGNISYFLGIKEDTTEKRKMMDDLLEAKEKAEESDRLKSAFLANMSHEIRTPLNSIMGFSELITDADSTDKEKELYSRNILNSGNQLLSIITNVIEISKIETGELEIAPSSFSLSEILVSLGEEFRMQAAEKGLILRTMNIDDAHGVTLQSDKNRVLQILRQLLVNAIKFTGDGTIEINYLLRPGTFEISIKDTGIGIPEEFHAAIFQRFRQVQQAYTRRYGGIGLGLAIAQGTAEQLGGKISVVSEPGNGSTFTLELPH